MINDLLLLSGGDIPFPALKLSVHQPTIREISLIGEETFFVGCELLRFSKNKLDEQGKNSLENQTDFDIILSIMKDKTNAGAQESAASALLVLFLMFPNCNITVKQDCISLLKNVEVEVLDNNNSVNEQTQEFVIDNRNYNDFKEILVSMFGLKQEAEKEYNPGGALAQKIADKLRRGKAKAAESKNENEKISVYGRYVSILSVGEGKDMNQLLNYTVYQLSDEFQRYQLKLSYDIYLQAKMAGAKDLKEAENWMEDIHQNKPYYDELLSS